MWKIFVIYVNVFLHFTTCESFHTCETIFSCMWTSNFTCIIDAMHVKFFTSMWTLLGMSEWACKFFFQGLLNATTMNHIFMKMPWISSEYPMKDISWPMKTAKLSSCLYFWPRIFYERVTFYLVTHEFRMTRDSWALNFLWKLVTEYFMGHETMEQDFQGIKFSMNSSQSISWAMKP